MNEYENFILTKEHKKFTEFCNACKEYRYMANSKLKCNKQVPGPHFLFLFSFFVKNFDIFAVKDLVEKRLTLANILFLIPGITERRLENNASNPTLATFAGEILVSMP